MPLDLSKLQNVVTIPEGHQAACPACRQIDGRDSAGNHLRIWRDGRYSCVVCPSDRDHNAAIWALAGDGAAGEVSYTPPPEPQVQMPQEWPASVLDRLVQDHSYWLGRGVPEEVVAPLCGGIATTGQLANRYVFPVYSLDDADRIIGFTGRALNPKVERRWKHLGRVASWVWGDLDYIRETGRAILVEGPGCRLALNARGHRGALVLFGTNISQAVVAFLISAGVKDIIVATNRDVKDHHAGQRAAEKVVRTLAPFYDEGVVRVELPIAKDFLDHTEEQWVEWERRVDPPQEPTEEESAYQDAPAADLATDEPTLEEEPSNPLIAAWDDLEE